MFWLDFSLRIALILYIVFLGCICVDLRLAAGEILGIDLIFLYTS
jgi:hypothetical protein